MVLSLPGLKACTLQSYTADKTADLNGLTQNVIPALNRKSENINEDNYQVLKDYLVERGHGPEEIQTIITRVEDYEEKTQHDSIMDSIGTGGMDIEALVREALGE